MQLLDFTRLLNEVHKVLEAVLQEKDKFQIIKYLLIIAMDTWGLQLQIFFSQAGFTAFGYGKSTSNSNITIVSSRKEDILSTMLSVFEMLEDTESVEEALDIVNFNPLNQNCTCNFLTLLKWEGAAAGKLFDEGEEEQAITEFLGLNFG